MKTCLSRKANGLGFIRLTGVLALMGLLLLGCGRQRLDPSIEAALPEQVDYNFHVKPLFSDRCYACHGPDDNARKADLRLYTEEGAKKADLESGGHAIVPGSLRRSKAVERIFAPPSLRAAVPLRRGISDVAT